MRFRLRTLVVVVSAAAVLAAVGGLALRAQRPVRIVDSAAGKQVLERLISANSVGIEIIWPPERFNLELSSTASRELVEWLGRAVRDDHPKNYVMSGNVRLEPPTGPD